MKLTLSEYREKVRGCWIGKNIGGTLGAPFECQRGVFDVWFYTQELNGEPLPNDDLDLQLVWLNAVEAHGRNVNSTILGEYWLSYIVPNWAEYGAGKNNMRAGLIPPLSGYVNNAYRESNGAFIRSEIWACLAPGHPEIAVRYAYEDAIVDHSGEGVHAEVFFAAVQSAAFVESETEKLIAIGLSYIPEDCGVARGVLISQDAYRSGLTWQEARERVLTEVPGSFGLLSTNAKTVEGDLPAGPMGYDAPSNVGITIIGWLYGEGDFGRSICIANNCGEDTDCTAATIGAIYGIIHGGSKIPQDWVKPIGDQIKTLCINLGDQGLRVPKTVTELTERILKLTPIFLGTEICDVMEGSAGYTLALTSGDALFHRQHRINCWEERSFKEHVLGRGPFSVYQPIGIILDAYLCYGREPFICESKPFVLKLTLVNKLFIQQYVRLKWHLPNGWEITPARQVTIPLEQYHCNIGSTELEFMVTGHALEEPFYDILLEIHSQGRPTQCVMPIRFLHSPFISTNKNQGEFK